MPRNVELQRLAAQRHYQANKEAMKLKARQHNAKTIRANTDVVRQVKSQPCTDCGKTYPFYVMQFDHMEGHEKLFTVSSTTALVGSRKRLLAEIAKCEVVCANCHAERTWQRRLAEGTVKPWTTIAE